ncbi:hypothetical protein ACCS93_33295 [Rhizobium ruizarguesonis]
MPITTTHQLFLALGVLSPTIAAMNLTSTVSDSDLEPNVSKFANDPDAVEKIARAIDALTTAAGLKLSEATDQVKRVVQERNFYGAFCELATYEWLARNGVAFSAQVDLGAADVLNPSGCAIDGQFTEVGAYFDIKGFGMQAYLMELYRKALRKGVPGSYITIDGPMDAGAKDIEINAFGKLSQVSSELAAKAVAKVSALGWTIRARPPRGVILSEHTDDPYAFAENNRYYTLKTSRQFTRNAPFVMIFPYAARFNSLLAANVFGATDVAIRSLARRSFIQLHSDTAPLSVHDSQTAPGLTVADASKLLSGILFINLDNDQSWLFLNPRAIHKLSQRHVDEIFDFSAPNTLGIDDFRHDDY